MVTPFYAIAHLPFVLLSISSAIGVDDRTIMNTRFSYCDKDLQTLAPLELFKDIITAGTGMDRGHRDDPTCYFFVRGAEEKTAKNVPNRKGFNFDLNVAREICKSYGTTVQTIRNDEEFNRYKYDRMYHQKSFVFGAKLRFLQNEQTKLGVAKSVWEVEKWDDDMPSVLKNAHFRGSPHTGEGNDAEALLLYESTLTIPAGKGFFVLQSHESVKDKIHFYCKQNMTTLKYHYPVWPTPAPSDEDELTPGAKRVDICEEKPDGFVIHREVKDRWCYFRIPGSMDKVNFQFQPGYYRFLFQRARAMCQEYVSTTLLTIHERDKFYVIDMFLASDEFYAVGVTLGQIEEPIKGIGPHYKNWEIKSWDKSDSWNDMYILTTGQLRTIYHQDDDDAAGLIFYEPGAAASKRWYVLQNSVGIRKKVHFLCKQHTPSVRKLLGNNTSQPTDRWGSSSSKGVSKKTTGKELATKQSSIDQQSTNDPPEDSSSSSHAPVDRQGQSPARPSSSPRIPGELGGPSPSPPPRSGCQGGNRKFIVHGFIALIMSSIILFAAHDH